MKILMLNGKLHSNPVAHTESDFVLPSNKETLAPALIDTVKALAADRLKKTDWHLTRFVGNGKEIPQNIREEREAIYAWCDAKEVEINSLEYGELLKYDATA